MRPRRSHTVTVRDRATRTAAAGQVLRVAYRHNTGGSDGAYHPLPGNGHRDDRWYGPYPALLSKMAARLGFIINITEPPAWIIEQATRTMGSSSPFDQCVYAAGAQARFRCWRVPRPPLK